MSEAIEVRVDHPVRAIHKVRWSPEHRVEHTGRFDDDGNAIFKKVSKTWEPGSVFVCTDPETLRFLLEHEAVEYLQGGELALWRKSGTTFLPVEPRQPLTKTSHASVLGDIGGALS